MAPAMSAAPAAMSKVVLVSSPRQNAAVGLASACAFLVGLSKFNDWVQVGQLDGAAAKGSRDQVSAQRGSRQHTLFQVARAVLGKSCSFREAFTVAKLSFMLLLRTYGSVWVSSHWGRIVKAVVSLNFSGLQVLVSQFAGATVLLSLLNSLLKYYISQLQLQIREKVTRWCHTQYFRPKDMVYYKANRVGAEKLDNCEHRLTSDVGKFSECFAEILSQSLKPVVDFLVYSVELSRVQGLATPLSLYAWYGCASVMSALTQPPFGELAAKEQELEGQFISRHTELIANCEQIAFLGGERPAKDLVNQQFDKLLNHRQRAMNMCFNFEIVRQYLNKYFVTVIGLFLISRPLRLRVPGAPALPLDQVAEYFSSTWENMKAMSTSIQDLFELSHRVGRFSGIARRVQDLMLGLEFRPPVLLRETELAKRGAHPPIFIEGEVLSFDHVSIYQPDGKLLVKDLNFTVQPGQRVLMSGGNGCGKSSLFRVLRGLWPLVEGKITRPPIDQIHFVSQVIFVPVGTLRDLVIYPHSRAEMERSRTDRDVYNCLRWAHVSPRVIVDGRAQLEFTDRGAVVRPELDDTCDWNNLSPGQKQKIAFARLFYHRPRYAILDECTNGVSPDVEHDLYERCAKLKLAVFSIAHKIELKLFHDVELQFHGDIAGTWSVSKCSEVHDKVTRSSAVVKLPEPNEKGKKESRITYERHIWFVE